MKSKILIVDDEAQQRSLEREILKGKEFDIVEAHNGIEAIEILRKSEFDAVLLDKNMGTPNGDEVCRMIRGDLKLTLLPVIMVTADSSPIELANSMRAGANDFIRKPYHPVELLSRVNAAISRKKIVDQLDSVESVLFALARMVEAKDEGTSEHCSRLMHIVTVFGTELELSQEDINALQRGAILHDIGKLGIPDRILLKNGSLTEDEWSVMRKHTLIGARLCEGLKTMKKTIPIIRNHHEKWDGSGYPDGLAGEEIPLLARIFQLADIYDALANERPYKKPWPLDKIISVFESDAKQGLFDEKLIAVFLRILRENPESFTYHNEYDGTFGDDIYSSVISGYEADIHEVKMLVR